jgi:hypothetical protein
VRAFYEGRGETVCQTSLISGYETDLHFSHSKRQRKRR